MIKKVKKRAVLLPMKDYKRLLEELEELDDIKLYDEAKAHKGDFIPIEEAFKIPDAKRNGKK
ncbi:MAG: hypothetical protein HKL88_05265 [Bacteroidia bacterium]|nr:hypothetical protein [Bacteroidia bacterium]